MFLSIPETPRSGCLDFCKPVKEPVASAAALRAVIDYIHANPVRRGLVARPEDWEWSSARWYAGLRPVKLEMDLGVLTELARG
jgi:hypothetical protein